MDQREEWNRARWASRRGLLELDLLLAPFVDEGFAQMSAELRAMYRELLFQDDQDLLEWVMAGSAAPEPRWQPVIAAIRRFHQLDA